MFSKPHYIALSSVLLVVLVVLNLPNQAAGKVKLAFGTLFLPLFGLSSSAQALMEKAPSPFTSRRALTQQVEQLQRENQDLRLHLLQAQEAERENARLRQLLAFKPPVPWKLKAAHVIGRDPANWWRSIQIDAGSRDGLRPDMPVLTAEGLVGRVANVSLNYSQVMLIGDANCRVSGIVDQTRETGVINYSPGSPLNPMMVNFTCFSKASQLRPGQMVLTSGVGGVFPKGIRIGEIVDFRTLDYGLYLEARVKLAVNANRLEEIWVLMQ